MAVSPVDVQCGFRPGDLPPGNELGRVRTYSKGALLWLRDQPSGSFFVVKRGEVEVLVPGHKSRDTVIQVVKPGEICGLSCFNSEHIPPTTGRALVQTEVLEIGCEKFLDFLQHSPRVALSVIASACERLAFAEERIHILAQRGAEERIITLLVQLAKRRGHASTAHPGFIRILFTHSELARLSGMNRAHVSVVLSRLREKDLIRYGRSAPPQVNMPALLHHVEMQTREGIG